MRKGTECKTDTWRERFKNKMIEEGATKNMAESKGVDFLINMIEEATEEDFKILLEGNKFLKKLETDVGIRRLELDNYAIHIEELKGQFAEIKDQLLDAKSNELRKLVNYIEEFNNSLVNCESQEGRDTMRTVQVFVNAIPRRMLFESEKICVSFIESIAKIICGKSFGGIREIQNTREYTILELPKS